MIGSGIAISCSPQSVICHVYESWMWENTISCTFIVSSAFAWNPINKRQNIAIHFQQLLFVLSIFFFF